MNLDRVFVYRDFRCGGAAFTSSLAKMLDKKFAFFTYIDETFDDTTMLFNTHEFDTLEEAINRYDPVLIRCERKNKVEQFFSLRTAFYLDNPDLLNITEDTKVESLEQFDRFAKSKVIVSKDTVIDFVEERKVIDELWNRFTKDRETQTVYYEDIVKNTVDIPLLNLYNVKLELNEHTKKFPDYKRAVYVNYNEVNEWINELYK